MSVIFVASTDLMSGQQTSRFIVPFLRWLIPDISLSGIATVQQLYEHRETFGICHLAEDACAFVYPKMMQRETAQWAILHDDLRFRRSTISQDSPTRVPAGIRLS